VRKEKRGVAAIALGADGKPATLQKKRTKTTRQPGNQRLRLKGTVQNEKNRNGKRSNVDGEETGRKKNAKIEDTPPPPHRPAAFFQDEKTLVEGGWEKKGDSKQNKIRKGTKEKHVNPGGIVGERGRLRKNNRPKKLQRATKRKKKQRRWRKRSRNF